MAFATDSQVFLPHTFDGRSARYFDGGLSTHARSVFCLRRSTMHDVVLHVFGVGPKTTSLPVRGTQSATLVDVEAA